MDLLSGRQDNQQGVGCAHCLSKLVKYGVKTLNSFILKIKKRLATVSAFFLCRKINSVMPAYDVAFFVVRPFQETFIRTALEFLAPEYRVALLRDTGRKNADGDWQDPPDMVDVYNISTWALPFLRVPVFVTPETAPRRSRLPACQYAVHIPHSPVSLHMIYPEGNFMAFDCLMAVGEHHEQEFRLIHDRNDQISVFPAGYGRMDILKKEYDMWRKSKDDPARENICVTIAPSWHEGNIIEGIGLELTERLLALGYYVIVRPHYKTAELKPDIIEQYRQRFSGKDNFFLDIAGKDNKSVLKADILVSDYSGVAYEYAFLTNRPVLFVDGVKKVRNENWKAIRTQPLEMSLRNQIGLVVAADCDKLLQAILDLQEPSDKFGRKITEARERFCYNFEEGAGKSIAKYVRHLIVQSASEP